MSKGEKYLIASVPDCNIDTQGENLINAIEMARDAISIWCVAEQDAGRALPKASDLNDVVCETGEFTTLVDADIDYYRGKLAEPTVKTEA